MGGRLQATGTIHTRTQATASYCQTVGHQRRIAVAAPHVSAVMAGSDIDPSSSLPQNPPCGHRVVVVVVLRTDSCAIGSPIEQLRSWDVLAPVTRSTDSSCDGLLRRSSLLLLLLLLIDRELGQHLQIRLLLLQLISVFEGGTAQRVRRRGVDELLGQVERVLLQSLSHHFL